MIKNAALYIFRKRKKSLILITIFSVILACIFACMRLLSTTSTVQQQLKQTTTSSFEFRKKDGTSFSFNQVEEIKKVADNESLEKHYQTIAKLENYSVVTGEEKIQRDDIDEEMKNVVSLNSSSQVNREKLFSSGVFSLLKGKMIEATDIHKIMIHEELASKNQLNLGDTITLDVIQQETGEKKKVDYEIVGIFSGKKQETYTGLTSDFSENTVFTDYQSIHQLFSSELGEVVTGLNIFASSSEELLKMKQAIEALPFNWEEFVIENQKQDFDDILESITGLQSMVQWMTVGILIAGAVVLSLMLMLSVRERIYEIGILLSIGIHKAWIIGKFFVELFLLTIPAIFVSLALGPMMVQQLMNGFISMDSEQSPLGNFISKGAQQGVLTIFSQSYALLAIVIVFSLAVTLGIFLMKKPKEILSKMS
ncbi:ABC transporter permease [Granulicatella elegans]|uniref:ABC transporter permease n=1 Tax=Granulicatella elegans TaxID=137732 RepID=UPI0028D0AD9C|nr:ABC transporter permease [Granulicatella elegans]